MFDRKRPHRLYLHLQVLSVVIMCIFFNIKIFFKFTVVTGENQTVETRCVHLGHRPWFHPFLASERPLQGKSDAIWRTIRGSSIYWYPGPVDPVSALNRSRTLRLQLTKEAALVIAKKDVAYAKSATSSTVYTRKFDGGHHISVLTHVQAMKATETLRVATVSLDDHRKTCSSSLTRPNAHARVNIVIAYSARENSLRLFLARIASAFSSDTALSLHIGARGEDGRVAARLIHEAGLEKHASVVAVNGDSQGNFSRAVALRDATLAIPHNELVFFLDVDMAVKGRAFFSSRANTVQGSQVWFPVVFSGYRSKQKVERTTGFWLKYGYGIACFYRSDFDAVGGFGKKLESRYSGWGGEDKDFFFRFRDHPRYAVFRSFEPDLFHVWHEKNCERNSHYDDCLRNAKKASRPLHRRQERKLRIK